jgi:tRNA-(ms[2]io[6]A)-hydroxylase
VWLVFKLTKAAPRVVLKVETPPAWAGVCKRELPFLLSDHVHCERKAAASALSFISSVPGDGVTVTAMAALAREESGHLQRVHKAMLCRGWPLLPDAKDRYVLALRKNVAKGRQEQLLDEFLVAALIEARSAERLGLLAEALVEDDLRTLYNDLARCEVGHASLFVERALHHAPPDTVAERLEKWLLLEAQILVSLPGEPRIHG